MGDQTIDKGAVVRLFRDAVKTSYELFKVMVPVLIAVKILRELDLIRYLAIPLKPVMGLVGLPGEMGLVWATAMVNNLYSAIIVLLSLAKDTPMTTAQATVLCTMMLVAHTMPVELRIAQKSGPRLPFQAVSRLGLAFLLGWLLNLVYSHYGWLSDPVDIVFQAEPKAPMESEPFFSWVFGEIQNLFSIFLIILGLLLVMRILKRFGIIDLMNRFLRPVLKSMGIGPRASAVTVIGLTLGIAYGGGLIIREAQSGTIDKRDVFYAISLMGLSHALIEDTLLMMMIGGHLSGILWGRIIFSFLAISLLVRISSRLPRRFCEKFLWG